MQTQPLFRPEALAERQTRWLGTVLLVPRLSHRLFAIFAGLSTAAVLGMLFFASFTRKARIEGWLVPEAGLVQVFAPQPGVVTAIDVKEGAEVKKGERLLVMSAELQSAALGATQSEIALRLKARRDSLREERKQLGQLGVQQRRSLGARVFALQGEIWQLDNEVRVAKERFRLAQKTEARQRKLQQGDLIAEEQLQTAEEGVLDQAAKVRDLERLRIGARRDLITLSGELRDLPIKSRAEVANIDRSISTLEQELAEAEARREIVVPAPESGTVTAIQAERGGRPGAGVPLLSIVPAGSDLVAHMFCPSRAIGFLRPGQKVLVRYQPYPYQKFGHYEGTVDSISRSAVNPAELPAQLRGLTSLFGSGEPIYRITVRLARQTVLAYGKPAPLSPGMQLEADVVIESRRLIEWVLEPLFTLTGKWKS